MDYSDYFELPSNFGLDARAKEFTLNLESHEPAFEMSTEYHNPKRFIYQSDSYSSEAGSESSFSINEAPEDIFYNERQEEEKNSEIERMLMSLVTEGRKDNLNASIGHSGRESLDATASVAQLNQIVAAQAYLAAMSYPLLTSPIQYQTQSGVTLIQMQCSGPLSGIADNLAQPVFVILPPMDSNAVKRQPNVCSSDEQNVTASPCRSTFNQNEEVLGNISKLYGDQAGCRLLQQKLEEGNARQVASIYKESLKSICMMMTDPYGNYLFQKLLENGTTEQINEILSEIKEHLVDAALTINGTRSVQKLLETCKTRNQIGMIQSAIRPRIVDLCLDVNGSHVIQKAVQCFAAKDKNFIYTSVMTNCKKIACQKNGCCVLQRCLESASSEQQRALVGTIIFHALELMQDPFGNYVVQYVLDHGRQTEAWSVALKCIGNVALLSTQKFSSNVMEKCLEKANDQLLRAIVLELSAPETLLQLLVDQFANYVIQKAISVAPIDISRGLVDCIRAHMKVLKDSAGGRKILAKITKRFPNI